MPNKYTIIIGSEKPGNEGEPGTDLGIHVVCDVLTVEPSGALTLWKKVDDFRSILMQAFAPHEWKRLDYNGWEEEEIPKGKTQPPPAVQT